MANAIKYSSSAQSLALKAGNYWIGVGDVPKGPTSSTDYWHGITPPTNGYTIYVNKANNGPSIRLANSDAELITITNQIAGTSYNTTLQCFNYFQTQSDKMVVQRDYENIVTDGLVLNLDAGFLPSYPQNGSSWYDLGPNGRTGTLTNGAAFNSDTGGTISFDGTNDYVSINTAIGNAISTTSTISFWFYRTTTFNTSNTAVGQFLFGSYTDNSNRGIVYFASDAGYVGTLGSLLVSGGSIRGRVYTQQNSWPPGWYNIVFTRTASSYKIYVNGVDMPLTTVVNTATIAFPTNPTYTLLGANFFSSLSVYGFLPGNMANALFYNKVLSASEVTQNYNAQKDRFGL